MEEFTAKVMHWEQFNEKSGVEFPGISTAIAAEGYKILTLSVGDSAVYSHSAIAITLR